MSRGVPEGGGSESPAAPPVLRVLGAATPEEVAALVSALVAAGTSATQGRPPAPVSRWASRADAVRAPAPVGPDAWRTSAWPHRH